MGSPVRPHRRQRRRPDAAEQKLAVLFGCHLGYEAARLAALSILGDLKRELGDLDRVGAWLRVLGTLNSAPGSVRQPNVINGFSDAILELYGPSAGDQARSAVGLAELPLGVPVEIEAEARIIGS